jgi:hypothetical protein
MVNQSGIQIIGGRKVRVSSLGSAQMRRLEAIQKKRGVVITRQDITREANRIDQELSNINFGGTIQNFDKQFNQIKKVSPQVASKLKVNPQTVRNNLNNRINQIKSDINQSNINERKNKQKGRTANVSKERARQKGLRQGLQRLMSGELVKVKDIRTFANQLGAAAKKQIKLTDFNLKRQQPKQSKVLASFISPEQQARLRSNKVSISKLIPSIKRKNFTPVRVTANVNGVREQIKLLEKKSGISSIPSLFVLDPKQKLTPNVIPTIKGLNSVSTINKLSTRSFNRDITPITIISKLSKFTPRSILNKLNNLRNEAARGNKNAQASLIGIASLPVAGLDVGVDIAIFLGNALFRPSQTLEGLSQINLNRAGANFGAKLQSGDPKALAELFLVRGVKAPNLKPITQLPNNIKFRFKTLQDNLKFEKKLADELKRKAILKKNKQAELEFRRLSNKITKEIKALDKGITPKISSGQVARYAERLKTKNKKNVKRLFEQVNKVSIKKIEVKVVKGLPESNQGLINLLLQARKQGGKQFKSLKNKIKKQRNLNVVERRVKGKISFRLLEPKKQRKKGIKTGRTKVKEFIVKDGNIIIVRRKSRAIDLKLKDKLTKKDVKDLEFKKGQNLDKVEKDFKRISKKKGFLNNKRGQLNIFRNIKRSVKNTGNTIKRFRVKEKQLGIQIRKFNTRLKKPIKTRKQIIKLKKSKASLVKQKSNLKNQIKLESKTLSLLKTMVIALSKLDFNMASILKEVQAIANLMKSELKNLNDLKFNPIRPTPSPKPKGKPTRRPSPRTPLKPTPRRKGPTPKPRRPPKRPPTKPVKKPPKIRISLGRFKKTRKTRPGYLIKVKKGNKIMGVSDQLLPRIKAENTARRIVNGNTGNFPLSSSYEIVRVGKTKVKDDKNLVLESIFRKKRSKRTKVLIRVEIRKARLNTPKERKALVKAKRAKKK